MASVYRKLLSIGITHTYYADGLGMADFAIRPTAETMQRIRSHGMRFLHNDAGLYILYEASLNAVSGQYDPFIPAAEIEDGFQLRFVMELLNPWFYNVTAITPTKELRHAIWYYDSTLATPTMAGTVPDYTETLAMAAPEELDFRNAAFSFSYTLAGNPSKGALQVIGSSGTILQTYSSDIDENDSFTAFVELSRLKPGRYGLQKVNNGIAEGSISYFYFDPAINPSATFAVIDIKKDATWGQIQTFNADPARVGLMNIDIAFSYREVPWTYKVVFKKSATPDFEDITISEMFVMVDDNRYHDDEEEDKFFFTVVESVGDFNGYDMLEFFSSDDAGDPKNYPLLQETKKNLSLKIGEDTIYGDLPNLDYKNLKNEVIIYV